MTDLTEFIADIESKYFRTASDIGANLNALMVWNRVREFAGLSELTMEDLEAKNPAVAELSRYVDWWYNVQNQRRDVVPNPPMDAESIARWRESHG